MTHYIVIIKNTFLFSITLFFVVSCVNNEAIVEKYDNGAIKMKCEDISEYGKEGECKKYWPDGSIKSITRWKHDSLNGMALSYYSNGKIKSEVPWEMGVINGLAKSYYPDGGIFMTTFFDFGVRKGIETEYYKNGRIKRETDWITVSTRSSLGDITFANTERRYDSLGNKTYSGHFVEIDMPNDTLVLNEIYKVKLTLLNPVYDSVLFLVGEFDSKYNPVGNVDTLFTKSWQVELDLVANEIGSGMLRGIAIDQTSKDNGVGRTIKKQDFYFEKPYYVIDK